MAKTGKGHKFVEAVVVVVVVVVAEAVVVVTVGVVVLFFDMVFKTVMYVWQMALTKLTCKARHCGTEGRIEHIDEIET